MANYLVRRFGQIAGPFAANLNVVKKAFPIIGTKDDFKGFSGIKITAAANTLVGVNGTPITITADGYLILDKVLIKSLVFLAGAPASTYVDFYY